MAGSPSIVVRPGCSPLAVVYGFFETVSLCRPGWLRLTRDPPASASGLQTCALDTGVVPLGGLQPQEAEVVPGCRDQSLRPSEGRCSADAPCRSPPLSQVLQQVCFFAGVAITKTQTVAKGKFIVLQFRSLQI